MTSHFSARGGDTSSFSVVNFSASATNAITSAGSTVNGPAAVATPSFDLPGPRLLRIYQQSLQSAKNSALNMNMNNTTSTRADDEDDDDEESDDERSGSGSPNSDIALGSQQRRRGRKNRRRRRRGTGGFSSFSSGDLMDDDDDDDSDVVDNVDDIDSLLRKQDEKRSARDKRIGLAQHKLIHTGDPRDQPDPPQDGGDTALMQDILRRTHGGGNALLKRKLAAQRRAQREAEEDSDEESSEEEGEAFLDSQKGTVPAPQNQQQQKGQSQARDCGDGGGGGDGNEQRQQQQSSISSSPTDEFLPTIMRGTKVDFTKAAEQEQRREQEKLEKRKSLSKDQRFVLSGAVHSSHDAVKKFRAFAAGGNVAQERPALPTLPDVNQPHSARTKRKSPVPPHPPHHPGGSKTARAGSNNNNNNSQVADGSTAIGEDRDSVAQMLFLTELKTPKHGSLMMPVLGHASNDSGILGGESQSQCASNSGALAALPSRSLPFSVAGYGQSGMANFNGSDMMAGGTASSSVRNPASAFGLGENPSGGSPRMGGDFGSPGSYGLLGRGASTGGPSIEELLGFDPTRGADRHHQSYRPCRTLDQQPEFPQLRTKLGQADKIKRFVADFKRSGLQHGRHGIGELKRAWEAQQQFREERKQVMNRMLDDPKQQFTAPQALLHSVRTKMRAAAASKDHRERLDYYFEHIRNVRPYIELLFPKAQDLLSSSGLLERQLDEHDARVLERKQTEVNLAASAVQNSGGVGADDGEKKEEDQEEEDDYDGRGGSSVAESLTGTASSDILASPKSTEPSQEKRIIKQSQPPAPPVQQEQDQQQQQQQQQQEQKSKDNDEDKERIGPPPGDGTNKLLAAESVLAHTFLDKLQETIIECDGVSGLAQLEEVFLTVFHGEHVYLEHVVNLLALVAPLFGASEQQFLDWIREKRNLHEHRDRAVMVEVAKSEVFGGIMDTVDANFTLTVHSVRGAWAISNYGSGAEVGDQKNSRRSPVRADGGGVSPAVTALSGHQTSVSEKAGKSVSINVPAPAPLSSLVPPAAIEKKTAANGADRLRSSSPPSHLPRPAGTTARSYSEYKKYGVPNKPLGKKQQQGAVDDGGKKNQKHSFMRRGEGAQSMNIDTRRRSSAAIVLPPSDSDRSDLPQAAGSTAAAAASGRRKSPPPLYPGQSQRGRRSISGPSGGGMPGGAGGTGGALGSRRSKVVLRFRAENNRVLITTARAPIRAATWDDEVHQVRLLNQKSDITVELLNEADSSLIATGTMTVDGIGWKRPQTLHVELNGLGKGIATVCVEMEFPSVLGAAARRRLAAGQMPSSLAPSSTKKQQQQAEDGAADASGKKSPLSIPSPVGGEAAAAAAKSNKKKRSPPAATSSLPASPTAAAVTAAAASPGRSRSRSLSQ